MSSDYRQDDQDHFSFSSLLDGSRVAEPLDVQLERSLQTNLFKYCKIQLRIGIILISIWEFILWTICMSFSIYGFFYWTSPTPERKTLDTRRVYESTNEEDYPLIKIGLICFIVLFGLKAFIAILLFLGAFLKVRHLCLIWMIPSLIFKLILLGICVGFPLNIIYLMYIPIFIIWVIELWHVFIHWKILIRVDKENKKNQISEMHRKFLEDAMNTDGIDYEDDRTVIDIESINSDRSYGFRYGKRQAKKQMQHTKKKNNKK